MPDPTELRFVVDADDRLDHVLARRFPGASRRALAALFADGAVRVDGKRAKKGERARPGAEVTLAHLPATAADLAPQPDPDAAARLVVLHRDDELIAIAKPAGMPSQPLRAGEIGTAASGLLVLAPECAGVADDPRDGGLVHRLDIGTSGVLVAARTRAAWVALRGNFGSGAVTKAYLALTEAAPVSSECEAPLAQRGGHVVVDYQDGLEAHTRWEVVRALGIRRLVRCHATTGRMHQIRVHLATCGAPIVGDTLYGGGAMADLLGFFLHAARVQLPHPRTGAPLVIEAPLPPDRQVVLDRLDA